MKAFLWVDYWVVLMVARWADSSDEIKVAAKAEMSAVRRAEKMVDHWAAQTVV